MIKKKYIGQTIKIKGYTVTITEDTSITHLKNLGLNYVIVEDKPKKKVKDNDEAAAE